MKIINALQPRADNSNEGIIEADEAPPTREPKTYERVGPLPPRSRRRQSLSWRAYQYRRDEAGGSASKGLASLAEDVIRAIDRAGHRDL